METVVDDATAASPGVARTENPTAPSSGAMSAPARAAADHEVDQETGELAKPAKLAKSGTTARRETHKATRWLHTYLSMISLALVLFFGLTGVTLNHPSWTLGTSGSTHAVSGTLPAGYEDGGGSIDFLAISQYVQDTHRVRGTATDYSADATQGSMSFKGPGYAADLFFDVDTGAYDLTVDQQGLLAVMNDLHKGRDTGGAWYWTIDVAGGLLVAVAVTGFGLQFFLSRRRTKAYLAAGAGLLISVILILFTVN